jgi:hypothetical protein
MFYQDIFEAFDRKHIRYLVVGAIAMNLHGAPRMTADLDILCDLETENLSILLETLAELGYRPRLPVSPGELLDPLKRRRWVEEKASVAFNFFHPKLPYQEVDLLLQSPVSFSEAYPQRVTIRAGAIRIPVISIGHLIEMKRAIDREQDRSDIKTLERIKELKKREPPDVA